MMHPNGLGMTTPSDHCYISTDLPWILRTSHPSHGGSAIGIDSFDELGTKLMDMVTCGTASIKHVRYITKIIEVSIAIKPFWITLFSVIIMNFTISYIIIDRNAYTLVSNAVSEQSYVRQPLPCVLLRNSISLA